MPVSRSYQFIIFNSNKEDFIGINPAEGIKPREAKKTCLTSVLYVVSQLNKDCSSKAKGQKLNLPQFNLGSSR